LPASRPSSRTRALPRRKLRPAANRRDRTESAAGPSDPSIVYAARRAAAHGRRGACAARDRRPLHPCVPDVRKRVEAGASRRDRFEVGAVGCLRRASAHTGGLSQSRRVIRPGSPSSTRLTSPFVVGPVVLDIVEGADVRRDWEHDVDVLSVALSRGVSPRRLRSSSFDQPGAEDSHRFGHCLRTRSARSALARRSGRLVRERTAESVLSRVADRATGAIGVDLRSSSSISTLRCPPPRRDRPTPQSVAGRVGRVETRRRRTSR